MSLDNKQKEFEFNSYIQLYEFENNTDIITAEDINKKYKQLSLKWHPDKNLNSDNDLATQMFQKIQDAKNYFNLYVPFSIKEFSNKFARNPFTNNLFSTMFQYQSSGPQYEIHDIETDRIDDIINIIFDHNVNHSFVQINQDDINSVVQNGINILNNFCNFTNDTIRTNDTIQTNNTTKSIQKKKKKYNLNKNKTKNEKTRDKLITKKTINSGIIKIKELYDTITPHTITPHTITPHTITPHTITPHTKTPHTKTPHTNNQTSEPIIKQPDNIQPEYKSPQSVIYKQVSDIMINGQNKLIEFTLKMDISHIWNNVVKYMPIPNKYISVNNLITDQDKVLNNESQSSDKSGNIYKLKIEPMYNNIYYQYEKNNTYNNIINVQIINKPHSKFRINPHTNLLETYVIIKTLNDHDVYITLPNNIAIKIFWSSNYINYPCCIVENMGLYETIQSPESETNENKFSQTQNLNADNTQNSRGDLIVYFIYDIQKQQNKSTSDNTYTDILFPSVEEWWNNKYKNEIKNENKNKNNNENKKLNSIYLNLNNYIFI